MQNNKLYESIMKGISANLKNIINEALDNLGHEIEKGDWIEFDVKGTTIMAEITSMTDDKYTVKPFGFRYDPTLSDDEVAKIKATIKPSYNLNSKRKVYKLIKKI